MYPNICEFSLCLHVWLHTSCICHFSVKIVKKYGAVALSDTLHRRVKQPTNGNSENINFCFEIVLLRYVS